MRLRHLESYDHAVLKPLREVALDELVLCDVGGERVWLSWAEVPPGCAPIVGSGGWVQVYRGKARRLGAARHIVERR